MPMNVMCEIQWMIDVEKTGRYEWALTGGSDRDVDCVLVEQQRRRRAAPRRPCAEHTIWHDSQLSITTR